MNAQQCHTVDPIYDPVVDTELHFINHEGPFLVKLYIHILRKEDGSGGITDTEAKSALEILNADFNPQNIFFSWENCEIIPIEDDGIFTLAESADASDILGDNLDFKADFLDQFKDDGINVFLLPAYPGSTFLGVGFAVGAQKFPSTACVVKGTLEFAPFRIAALSHVLSHEVGHCLGLIHTHGDGAIENTDGSECFEKGDLLCDTNPDRRLNYEVDTDCNWTRAQQFPDYNPDVNNIMAETKDVCRTKGFTPDQGRRMRNMLATHPDGQAFVVEQRITTNMNWDTPGVIEIEGNLVLESGKSLTIGAGVTVKFGAQASLIIQPTAQLFLNGILTSKDCTPCNANDVCGPGWKGVVLQSENARFNSSYGAIIENAEVAITAALYRENFDPDTNQDGVVDQNDPPMPPLFPHRITANFTLFSNNKFALDLGTSKVLSGTQIGGISTTQDIIANFNRCDFITNDSYKREDQFTGFVKLTDSDGASFKGCTFKNNQNTLAPAAMTDFGFGISSYNSKFMVNGESGKKSEFINLAHGIYAGGGTSANTPFWIEQTVFEDCEVGISNRGVIGATIIFNEFKMGYLPASSTQGKQYGISLASTVNGIQLEENNFSISDYPVNQTTIGIHSYNTGSFNNTIRRNIFGRITVANQAGGVNGDANDELPRGLLYECNTNWSSTLHDFLICEYAIGPNRIRTKQGLADPLTPQGYRATANRFSYAGSPIDRDFANRGEEVDYFYDLNEINQEPLNYSGITKLFSPENTCPISAFTFNFTNSQDQIQKKQAYYNNREAYQTAKASFELAKSSGNTILAQQKSIEGDYYRNKMDKNAFDVLHHILYDSVNFARDSMRLWLANMETYGAEMALALDYLDEGAANTAFEILDDAPTKLNLSSAQLSDLGEVNLLFNLLIQKTRQQLVEEEIITLENIANGTGEYAPGLAENLLQIGGKIRYPRMCDASGNIEYWNTEFNHFSKEVDQEILAFPNPAKDKVLFKLTTEFNEKQFLKITSINGSTIDVIIIPAYNKTIQWDVQSIPNGIYFYQFYNNYLGKQGKILVQH